MAVRSWKVLAVIAALAGATSCSPEVDLAATLDTRDVFTGWYDNGVRDGLNHLVPSVSFRLHNKGSQSINHVQMTVSFWQAGADGEWDSKEVRGIDEALLPPGASTDPVLVRAGVGYTLEQRRAELFTHSAYKDAVVKLFAKRGGRIVALGEHTIERRILPHVSALASQ